MSSRSAFASVAAAIGLATVSVLPAAAQTYPSRPVRVIVPFAPGGTVDVFARIASEKLTQKLGQSFYVENIAGASGNIATGQAARAAPDGYTLFAAFSTLVINPSLFATVPYDPVKDFEPITLAVSGTHVITVTPSVPAKSLKELVDLIRTGPTKYSYSHGGAGTPGHLLGEQFRLSEKLDIAPVPFNGTGPAITAVIAGHVPISFSTVAAALPQIQGNQLRALAVTSKARTAQLKDVPTTGEAGFPAIVGDIWVGMMAPAGTPKEIIAKLNAEFVAAINQPDTKEKLAKVGFDTVASSADAFRAQIASELVSWRTLISAAKIGQK